MTPTSRTPAAFTARQSRNNFLVFTALVVFMFLAATLMNWVTIDGSFTATGRTGSFGFAGTVKLPIWLLLVSSAAATGMAGLNIARVTSIPFLTPILILLVCGAYYTLPFFAGDEKTPVRMSAGPYVALAATFAALVIAFVRPRHSV